MIKAVFLLAAVTACASDWPQWRGLGRDAITTMAPAKWPEKLTTKWKIKVGEGHSSPIFAAGRIYDFARDKDREVVRAVDPASGKVLWEQSYAAPYEMNGAATSHGKGPKSTPVFAAGKVYTFGINGALAAWDAATGKQIWMRVFSKQYSQTSPSFGVAMSPVVWNGTLYAHVGGDGNGAMMAFDPNTGEDKWSWKGDGPAYSSPVIAVIDGTAQLITQSEKNVIGLDAKSGQLLWKIPFTTPYAQNSVTPLVLGDVVIYSGLEAGITAIRVTRAGSAWKTTALWKNTDISLYMNSPVAVGDALCGLSHKNKGQYFCMNKATGKVLWTSPGRQAENAAIVIAGEWMVSLEDDGELLVLPASATQFRQEKRYAAAQSATWAHPVFVAGGIVVKDFESLMMLAY